MVYLPYEVFPKGPKTRIMLEVKIGGSSAVQVPMYLVSDKEVRQEEFLFLREQMAKAGMR